MVPRGGLSARSYNANKINDLWLPKIPLLYQPNVPASITKSAAIFLEVARASARPHRLRTSDTVARPWR
jgi:hypothetical protein